MRTGPTRTTAGSGKSTVKRVLTLLGFTLLAGYLLGKRRTERSWEARREESEEPDDGGVTVEVQDGSASSIPGESMIGEESEPGEEVPETGTVRDTPEPGEVDGEEETDGEDGSGDEETDATDGNSTDGEEAGDENDEAASSGEDEDDGE